MAEEGRQAENPGARGAGKEGQVAGKVVEGRHHGGVGGHRCCGVQALGRGSGQAAGWYRASSPWLLCLERAGLLQKWQGLWEKGSVIPVPL